MKLLLAWLLFLFTSYVQAFGWAESPKVGELFNNAAVNGTFVVYEVTAQKDVGDNAARSIFANTNLTHEPEVETIDEAADCATGKDALIFLSR